MSVKKIAIISSTFPPYRGGIGKVAETDAEQLAANGFEVTVLTPGKKEEGDENRPYKVRRLKPFVSYGNASFCPQLSRIWNKFDLVILHYPFYGGAEPLIWRKPKSGGAKFALVYHMDTFGKGIIGLFFSIHRLLFASRIIKKADILIGTTVDYLNNSQVASLIKKEGLKTLSLPPSVDIRRFSPGEPDSELLAKYGLDGSDKILVFVGGLDQAHYFKGIPYLLEAMMTEELSEIKAVIVGDGDMRSEYEGLSQDMGLANRVVFAGRVSEEDLSNHYRLGHVFGFPSTDSSEAFGIAALEAMACGLPVVASDLPGVRTIVRNGETGLLSRPGDSDSFAANISKLIKNQDNLSSFGQRARQMAVEEYSDEARAQNLARIVEEAIKRTNQ